MPINPTSLDVLKRTLGLVPSTGEEVSQNVLEADPSLTLDKPTTEYEARANEHMKQLLGLGPSSTMLKQQAEQDARDKALSEAQTELDPTVQAANQAKLAANPAYATEAMKLASDEKQQAEQDAQTKALLDRYTGGGGQNAPAGGPVGMKPSVNAKGQVSFAPVMQPAQVQTQQHAAQIGLDELDKTSAMIDTLNQRGLIGPIEGRKNSALTTTGLDAYLMHPADAAAFSDFKNQLSLTKSNMGYVHGGTRGGSSQALLNRFDQLVNPNMSAAGMKGALSAYRNWLSEYAAVPENDVQGQEAVSQKYLNLLGGQ